MHSTTTHNPLWWVLWACAALCFAVGCGDDTSYSGNNTTDTSSSGTGGQGTSGATSQTGTSGETGGGTSGNTATGGTETSADAGDTSSDGGGGDDVGPDSGDAGGDVEGDVPDTETIGGECLRTRDCSTGETCIGANAIQGVRGYCTVLDCQTSADCEFPRGGTFCCSNFGEYRGCFREEDGAVCGTEEGEQNDPCGDGGQSDCNGEGDLYCAQLYGGGDNAICINLCDPANPVCPDGTACLDFGGGSGGCVPIGDAQLGESCADDPYSCAENSFCIGADQNDPYAYCNALCTQDSDCLPSQWCQIYPGQTQGVCANVGLRGEGESCTEDRFGCEEGLICLYEGTRYARCTQVCSEDVACQDENLSCTLFGGESNLGVCLAYEGRPTGEECGDDPFACEDGGFCVGGYENTYNAEAYCASNCSDDPSVCPDGFYCQEFDGVSYCQPDGESQEGEACETALDCERETYCINPNNEPAGYCVGQCNADTECPDGEYCTGDADNVGVCYPFGTIPVGESCASDPDGCVEGAFCAGAEPVCISECTDAPDSCPDGMYCLDENQNGQRFCYPAGDVSAGESCEGAYDCEPGSFCSPTGDGESLCLPGCEADTDCPNSMWCLRTRTTSQCRPYGEGQTGDSCADDPYACDADHLCLYSGTAQAYCAKDCTGFANTCGEGETCRYLGWGINLCFPTGDGDTGTSCIDDPQVCDEGTICAGTGFVNAFCADICTFDRDVCAEGTSCVFTQGGLGLCLPPDFDPGDPVGGGGGPL